MEFALKWLNPASYSLLLDNKGHKTNMQKWNLISSEDLFFISWLRPCSSFGGYDLGKPGCRIALTKATLTENLPWKKEKKILYAQILLHYNITLSRCRAWLLCTCFKRAYKTKKPEKTNDKNESLSFTVFVVGYSFMSLKAEKAFELTSLYW